MEKGEKEEKSKKRKREDVIEIEDGNIPPNVALCLV